MRYVSFLMTLFLCLSHQMQAQPASTVRWQHVYGSRTADDYEGLAVRMPAGGYLLVGRQAQLAGARGPLHFVRTDEQGDTLWTKLLLPPNFLAASPNNMLVDPSGNVLVTGREFAGSRRSFVMKLTPACDTIWTRTIRPASFTTYTNVSGPTIGADGHFVLAKEDGLPLYPTSPPAIIEIIKLDASTGRTLWARALAPLLTSIDSRSVRVYNIIATSTGYLAFLKGMAGQPHQFVSGTLLLDQNGNLGTFRVRRQAVSSGIPALARTADGNLVAAARQTLTKLTPAGDTLWHTAIPSRYSNRTWNARGLVVDAQGSFLVIADSYFTQNGGGIPQVHVARFRAMGQLVSDTMLLRGYDAYAGSAMLSATGELVFSGYGYGFTGNHHDLFLTQYRGFRPLATRAATAVAAAALRPFPNPAGSGGATLPLPAEAQALGGTLRLYDALGRCCARLSVGRGTAALALPLAGLAPGLYVLRFERADGQYAATGRLLHE